MLDWSGYYGGSRFRSWIDLAIALDIYVVLLNLFTRNALTIACLLEIEK
jgi:hypothetical protein